MKRTALGVLLVLGATGALMAAPQREAAAPAQKPVLKYLGRDATFDLSKEPMIPILEELTGYKLELETLPAGEEGRTKLMTLIASGTSYDLINSYPAHFDALLAAKALQPLDDLLKGAPNLTKLAPLTSKSWRRVKSSDGRIYGIPQMRPNIGMVSAIVFRKDLAVELGLAPARTPEELYAALAAVKARKPDMIPFTTEGSSGRTFGSATIASGFDAYDDWKEINGKLVPLQKRQEYKDYIAFLTRLYKDGLYDQEFPANQRAAKNQKFTSGKAFSVDFGAWEGPGFYSALAKAVPGSEIDYLPFLKDKAGAAGYISSFGLEKISSIPVTARHPRDAVAWTDAFMASFKQIYIGSAGVEHELKDGKYRPILPAFNSRNNVWWFLPAVDEANVFGYWQARVRKAIEVERGYMETYALATPEVRQAAPFFELHPPNQEFIKLQTALSTYWYDEMVKIIAGSVPFGAYDQVVARWEADGGARMTQLAESMK